MLAQITATTQIGGLPVWVANVWRGVVWLMMLFLISDYLRTLPGAIWHRRAPSWALYGRGALLVFVFRSALLMVERWDQPGLWETLPPTTLAVGLALTSRILYRRAKARGDFFTRIEP